MGDEADALNDQCDGGAEDHYREELEATGHWIGADGTVYKVDQMSNRHIDNVILHLQRKIRDCNESDERWCDEWLDTFIDIQMSRASRGIVIGNPNGEERIKLYKQRYKVASKAEIGTTINCPTCNKELLKNTYNRIFNSTKCKNKYWNTVDDVRRARARAQQKFRRRK